jgi:hypothetical protein
MAVSYSFKTHDGLLVDLDTIDKEVCRFWDKEVDDKEFSFPYQILTLGIVALAYKKDYITGETVTEWLEENDEQDPKWKAFYKKFMYEDYDVEVWA